MDKQIQNLPSSLQSLHLNWCKKLTNEGLNTLFKRLINLKSLHLRGIHIKDEAIHNLPNQLEDLQLSYGNNYYLTDETISDFFKKLQNLKTLDLSGLKIHDQVIASLPSHLEKLKLDCTNLTDTALYDLWIRLPKLQSLELHEMTDKAIVNLPVHLLSLSLNGGEQLSDQGFSNALEKLKNLESLEIHSSWLTDQALAKLPKSLQKLVIADSTNLTDLSLAALPTNLTVLILMNFHQFTQFTDAALENFFKKQQNLFKLALSLGEQNTDKALACLPANLSTLFLSVSSKITKDALKKLFIRLKNLNYLELENCDLLKTDPALVPTYAKIFRRASSIY